MRIEKITSRQAKEIIETREPRGIFYLKDNGFYVGINNSTGDAWTEEFHSKYDCIAWLKQKYEEMKSIEIINTVPSKVNPNYRMHMLVKYECLDCENSFILSKKQADEANEITCPYCKTYKIEETVLMVDGDKLEEMGCMGIAHVEEGEKIET